MSLWRKLAYDLAEDMLVPSEPNNRNMSTVNIAYQLNVRCNLYLWNEEFKIVQQSCPLVLRTAFSLEGSDVLKKNWHRYTQTHINTDTRKDTHTHTLTHIFRHTDTQTHTNTTGIYTHTDTDTQTPLHPWSHTTNTQMHKKPFKQQSHTQTQNTHNTHILPTHIDHHTTEFLKAMSQLCDGIQCRLTARTAGSTEGEILAESWKRSKQTE